MPTISACITVLNNETRIKTCLESLKWVDEIIVVDRGSTDKTVKIAKTFTKRVYIEENNPDAIDVQKNDAFEKAKSEWILSIDADEELETDLASEIRAAIETNDIDGYYIPRKNIIFNKWLQHTGWYPDYQLRLFKKGKGKYTSKKLHQDLFLEGKSSHLKHHILHHNYDTVSQFLYKQLFVYAKSEADYLYENGYSFSLGDSISKPFSEFLSRFFARKGYLDGTHGLILSLLMAFYQLVVVVLLWEKEKFVEDTSGPVAVLEKEVSGVRKQLMYWLTTAQIQNSKNTVSKTFLRLKRKLAS